METGVYTGNPVRLRCGASLLTLLVAAAPVSRFVCELVCAQPPSTASSSCHDTTTEHQSTAERGEGHACGQVHVAPPPALLKADTGRGAETFSVPVPLFEERVRPLAPLTESVLAAHGPPGSLALDTESLTTILRI
jgi:hypothetical protein